MVAPSGEIVRRNSLLHLAKVSGVSDASFALDAWFGKELKANPASDFEANQFDSLDNRIRDFATKRSFKEVLQGIFSWSTKAL